MEIETNVKPNAQSSLQATSPAHVAVLYEAHGLGLIQEWKCGGIY